ncbi:exosortase A [Sphingomonas oligophenolica]|uniref:Exosortase A n=1 Tax=Sphingomonas oligophenolica TaxID=301154 RepID=A0A502CGS7_9SPHN|nr:exosortase A [Sphingomonas oligophenolica]TPG12367.1 exosortase A [Sphingomonas oligophenolica]
MTAVADTSSAKDADTGSLWSRHATALAIAAAGILLLFHTDIVRMVGVWWTASTYGHCFLIAPIVGWLVWQRRGELAQLAPTGWWPGLALVAVGGLGWLMGDAGSVAFARQLGVVMMLQGAVVTILGPIVARGLLFPLLYALFLVPFGEWLEAPLQRVTVAIIMPLLDLVGIPATSNGVLIHAGRYYFEVAEACSGTKFVVAMFAFGVLVCNLCFVSWRRRAVFMAVALVVPILANGVRAFATIWVADITNVEAATGFDHIVYGWVFFGLVMAGVLALGWRWFDKPANAAAFDPARIERRGSHRLALVPAALLTVAVAASFPLWSAAIGERTTPLPAQIALPDIAGWHRVPLSVGARWMPVYPGADHYLFGRYAGGDAAIDVAVAVYGSQREGKKIVGYGIGALGADDRWLRVADLPALAGGSVIRIAAPGPVERVVATWYRIGDTTTADPRQVKIATMAAHLLGGDGRAVALHVSAEVGPGDDPQVAIRRFLAAAGPPDRLIARIVDQR